MDEVWMVSLCLTLLAIMVVILSLRKPEPECQSDVKGKERSREPSSPSHVEPQPQATARYLELTLEDIEKSLERLGAVLGSETSMSDSPASCSGSEEQPHRDRRWEANPKSHPRGQGKVFEHQPVQNAENFTEHIVQETVDHNRDRPEVVRARRVTPPSSRIENKTNDDGLQSEKLDSSD